MDNPTVREVLLNLLEEWLELILKFKRKEFDAGTRDLMSIKIIDQAISALDALYKAKYKEYHCKYSTINHGIGLSGKVEEIIVHCSMNPENDYKDSAIQEMKRRMG